MTERGLSGKAVVVPLGLSPTGAASVARRLAHEGAAVVLVAEEGDAEAGRLATELAPARATVMVLSGDEAADLDALVELVAELFP